MNQTPPSGSGWTSLGIFLLLFAVVFFAVVTTATLITFIMPLSFVGTACVFVQRTGINSAEGSNSQSPPKSYDLPCIQTELGIIQSDLVLGKVVEQLDLNTRWGNKYGNGEKLKTVESFGILKGRLSLRLYNRRIIEIRMYTEDPVEAATLANAIAKTYAGYSNSKARGVVVEIFEHATPGLHPVRPNKPINIALGMLLGAVLGAVVGGAGAALARSRRLKSKRPPAIS